MAVQSTGETTVSQPMLADIRRQPEILARVVRRRAEIEAFTDEHVRPGDTGRIHAFGSGDGWFAARSAQAFGPLHVASGLDFLLRIAPTLTSADRAIAISMSGNVDRTVEAATAATQRSAAVAALTNAGGGRLGALGLPKFSLGIDDLAPFLCGTSSYTATVAALALIGAHLAGRSAELAAALDAALVDLHDFIALADAWATRVASAAAAGPGVRILSSGHGVATAEYGAAKFVEVTTIPSWADDIEEFAHRQYWSMKPRELVVFVVADDNLATYATASREALGELGTPTAAVVPAGAAVAGGPLDLPAPGGGHAAPITHAVALQLLAYRMGRATGTDPDRRLHLKADETRFAVSRRLTRRSLMGTGL